MLQERPFLLPFFAMASGLVISDLTGYVLAPSSLLPLLLCGILSAMVQLRPLFCMCVTLLFLGWGLSSLFPWSQSEVSQKGIVRFASSETVVLEGVVRDRPIVSSTGSRIVLLADQVISGKRFEPVDGAVMLHVGAGEVTINRGDRVRCRTKISVPQRLGLPGEYDYGKYLRLQGIPVTGRVASQDDIVLIRAAAKDTLLRHADLSAQKLGAFVRMSIADPAVSSILTALMIGDQKRIPVDLSDAYTRAGVNHILSVSGFHVGIIAYFIVTIALWLASCSETLSLRVNLRRSVLLLSLPAMLLYLLLTGSAPATARSVIMLAIFVLALCAERETDPVNTLLMSACLLLAIHPPTLFDASFQLSFLALWAIVVFVPAVMVRLNSVKHAWQRTLIQFFAASCAASIATTVPVLYMFNQTSFNGILANVLVVPLLGYGAVLLTFCSVPFIYVFPPFAHFLLVFASWVVVASNWLVRLFSHLPVITFYGITAVDMFVCIFVLCALTFIRNRRVKILLCCGLPIFALFVHMDDKRKADGSLHVTMLSVGQAESLLVRLPDGAVMLVDGGGYLHETGRDFGERVLAPALHKLGVKRIDYLVLTHPHPDHLGGLPFIARTIPIGAFLEPVHKQAAGEEYRNLRSALKLHQVPFHTLSTGDRLSLPGKVTLQVLSPERNPRGADGIGEEPGLNEDSLVFRLEYGNFGMLFTADAGFFTEEHLMAGTVQLASTVLKVGHHGSRFSTSEAFLDRVGPKAALISAGAGNAFGLPSAQTLLRLDQRGIKTFRTDRDGTLELVTDGREWSVTTPYRAN